MPTCSQAKIITNLESDISRRFYKLAQNESSKLNLENNDEFNNLMHQNATILLGSNKEMGRKELLLQMPVQTVQFTQRKKSDGSIRPLHHVRSLTTMKQPQSRRISVDDLPLCNNHSSPTVAAESAKKAQIIFSDFVATKRDSVPVNFLYNSSYRCQRNSLTVVRNNSLRSSLTAKNNYNNNKNSDGEEDDENSENSDQSIVSLPDNVVKVAKFKLPLRKSIDFGQISYQKKAIEKLEIKAMNGNNLSTNMVGVLSTFPKLALESELECEGGGGSEPGQKARRMSVDHAKRLLALASIRPSKTFHKQMSDEEIEILKKYYDIIKPKVSVSSQSEVECDGKEEYKPIVYDTGKVSFVTLQELKKFLDAYKKDIESGVYEIEYDAQTAPSGFVLKKQSDSSVVKFPSEVNDAFFAVALTTTDRENSRMYEANLYRVVNWNDANKKVKASLSKRPSKASLIGDFFTAENRKIRKASLDNIDAAKLSRVECKIDQVKKTFDASDSTSTSSSPTPISPSTTTSSALSFEYIRSLSSLVNSVIQPKLLKQLTYSGVDLSTLPGGANFEVPTFEELGINLKQILNENCDQSANVQVHAEYQSSKLKNSAYKKLKERVSTNKVMWFNGPPERKPMSIIFEYAGVEIGHETVLAEVNQYLKEVDGYVESVEFVPRSVHFGSVYVENFWILTLNNMNTKFFTLTNGIKISNEKISVKSYDEFIFAEYEKFIRNEKYKLLIKNHEKCTQLNTRRNSKKSI